MARIKFTLTICIGVFICQASPVMAQCSDPCRPQAMGRLANGTVRFAAGAGMSGHMGNFLAAAGEWGTALNSVGASVDLAEGGGGWTVDIDSSMPSYLAGETDYANNRIRINGNKLPSFYAIAIHEIGHAILMNDVGGSGCSGQTAMFGQLEGNPGYVTTGDYCTVDHVYRIRDESPIILTMDPGFPKLTGPEVLFDLSNSGTPQLLGWTQADANEGFLVLDRDGNGMITSGAEMFGNYTPFPDGRQGCFATNGFQALAAYDELTFGGNGDRWITRIDRVFGQLRLWIDSNHNGVSESDELRMLADLGIDAISLSPVETTLQDRYGNQLRYIAPFLMRSGARGRVMRLAVDVYFVQQQ